MLIDLSYLRYPLPPDVQRLFEAGDFSRMERVIAARLADPRTPETLKKRLTFQLAIAREIPVAYPLTRSALLAQLQAAVRDFLPEELEALRDDGTLDWRYVEGEVHFKDNCVNNLLKTRPEFASRAVNQAAVAASLAESAELDGMITRMKRKGHARTRFVVRETMTVESTRLLPSETLHIHLPLPVVSAQVISAQLLSTSHAPNCIADAQEPHRTVYFELPYQPGMTVSAEFAYEIDAPYIQADPAAVSNIQPDFETGEEAPHIVFTPYIRALTREIVGTERNPLLKARRIYDFITTQAVYRFMPPYLTVTNIPEYFLTGLRGDCGVQALAFITLCRCAGIPAKWQAGLYTTPRSAGNHDWAMFYIAPYGWLYADCSFGGSAFRAGNEERRNFYFGNLEPWRLPLCVGFQQTFTPPRRFLRRDPYDNQNGEIETLNRRLDHNEYDTDCQIVSYEEIE